MRLPMDNPIFVKLQNIIERRSRSPQWFSMAEQAINTIYLLGQQPDALCGAIIKSTTAKLCKPADVHTEAPADDAVEELAAESQATASPKATTMSRSNSESSMKTAVTSMERPAHELSAYALAQLVFIVGHVALKHIVYLELVEREFKRRKDEKAKGGCFGWVSC